MRKPAAFARRRWQAPPSSLGFRATVAEWGGFSAWAATPSSTHSLTTSSTVYSMIPIPAIGPMKFDRCSLHHSHILVYTYRNEIYCLCRCCVISRVLVYSRRDEMCDIKIEIIIGILFVNIVINIELVFMVY